MVTNLKKNPRFEKIRERMRNDPWYKKLKRNIKFELWSLKYLGFWKYMTGWIR